MTFRNGQPVVARVEWCRAARRGCRCCCGTCAGRGRACARPSWHPGEGSSLYGCCCGCVFGSCSHAGRHGAEPLFAPTDRLLRLAAIMAAACGTATSEWDHTFALRDGPFTVRELLWWRAESYVARGAPSLSLWHSLDTLRGSPILLSFLRIFWSNLTRVAVPHFPRPLRTGPAVRAELSSSDARASHSGRSVAVDRRSRPQHRHRHRPHHPHCRHLRLYHHHHCHRHRRRFLRCRRHHRHLTANAHPAAHPAA